LVFLHPNPKTKVMGWAHVCGCPGGADTCGSHTHMGPTAGETLVKTTAICLLTVAVPNQARAPLTGVQHRQQ